MWEEPYPDTESWALAGEALALDSMDGFSEHLELLEQAQANAGEARVLFEDATTQQKVLITPVIWRTAPYLATHASRGYSLDVLLFRDLATAEEWARRRVLELLATQSGDG